MTKSFDFAKLFKLAAVAAAGITVIGVLLLIILGSGTHPAYSGGNIGSTFYLKAFLAVVFACALITLYFGIRFRKKHGFKAGLIASVSAFVSAFTSFFICVIFRAPLCGYVFSVILLAVCISLICAVVHFDFLNSTSRKKHKNTEEKSASAEGFRRILLFLFVCFNSCEWFSGSLPPAFREKASQNNRCIRRCAPPDPRTPPDAFAPQRACRNRLR